jgi:hypothetical protein
MRTHERTHVGTFGLASDGLLAIEGRRLSKADI